MRIVTAKAMQAIDQAASQKFGIPAIVLMENAATASVFCLLEMLKTRREKVFLFCGPGNNGGDGFACARHLLNRGLKVKVFFLGRKARLSNEAKTNYMILRKMGQALRRPKLGALKNELKQAGLVVDALFGIGLKSNLKGGYLKLIEMINAAGRPILSLDIPSGLNATTGEAQGAAVKAARTITFGLLKTGMLKPQARKFVGKIVIGDIGLPRKLLI